MSATIYPVISDDFLMLKHCSFVAKPTAAEVFKSSLTFEPGMHLDRFSAKGALYVKVPPWCRKVNMVGGMTMVRPDEFLILKIHLGLAIPFSYCYWLAAKPCSFVSALSMACFSSTFVARVRTCTSWLHLVKESIIVRSLLGMLLACPHVCGIWAV